MKRSFSNKRDEKLVLEIAEILSNIFIDMPQRL